MPELPEIEAWRRLLDPDVKRSPVATAGPAHIATLKTFDPPLAALEGEGFQGARRRAKRLLKLTPQPAAGPIQGDRELELDGSGTRF